MGKIYPLLHDSKHLLLHCLSTFCFGKLCGQHISFLIDAFLVTCALSKDGLQLSAVHLKGRQDIIVVVIYIQLAVDQIMLRMPNPYP